MTEEGNGPKTVAITTRQGGPWLPFEPNKFLGQAVLVHSIKFANGAEWDVINGWRKTGEQQ